MRLTADATDATTPLPAAPMSPPEPPLTVVEARSHWSLADLREVWRFRELFYYLTLRDIKVRYKQTILGVGWSVFQPLATMLVFVVFIGWMGKAAEGVENYLLFVLAGVLPWVFFSNAVTNAANSLIANERLVTKTYFPRLLLPASNVGAALFDFVIGLVLLAVWIAIAGPAPTWQLVVAPVAIVLLALTAFGFGTLLSALIATQRDFRYVLAFGMQLWMFATPCLYLPTSAFGPMARAWLPLNPAYGLILNFRAAVLGEAFDWPALALSTAVGLLVTGFALIYFRRVDRTLADTL